MKIMLIQQNVGYNLGRYDYRELILVDGATALFVVANVEFPQQVIFVIRLCYGLHVEIVKPLLVPRLRPITFTFFLKKKKISFYRFIALKLKKY